MAAQAGVAVPAHAAIYLLPSRPWLHKLGLDVPDAMSGGLAALPDEAIDAVCRDVDVVWLQGIWEVGPAGRAHDLAEPGRLQHFKECLPGDFIEEDCIGSPYAITRYVTNPVLGSDEDLANFRARLAKRGVGLMLDFVPNHTARDSPWVEEPGIHIQAEGGTGAACGRDPYSGDWTDTAQLNYWSQACRDRMLQALLDVADRCDGVRVDMAMLCCNPVFERTWGHALRRQGFGPQAEFWPDALRKVRECHPRFYVLAECYEYEQIFPHGTGRELLRQGFDAVYDKVTYDRLIDGHMDHLRGHIFGDPLIGEGRLCHFTENHDEPRAAEHFGGRALAATVASLTLPGPRMAMWGQELGLRNRLAVHLRRSRAEEPDAKMVEFFAHLLKALPGCRGTWKPCQAGGDGAWRLLSWGWQNGKNAALVVVNYTGEQAWADVHVHEVLGSAHGSVRLRDLLSGESYDRDAGELLSKGLVVGLAPFQAHLFTFVTQ